MAARSLAARALRTALEALVFGDFIILSCAQAAPGSGALGAELCCLAIGATAGRLGAYLLERCGAEAAQLCAHAVHSGGGLGWAQVSRFFVSKASEAAQGGVGGLFICLRWRSAILRELQFVASLSDHTRDYTLQGAKRRAQTLVHPSATRRSSKD